MATNGRKRYFHIDENASNEQIYALLDDVERADEDNIDNLMNDSDTEFRADEEITQAASTQNTSLTTAEANLHVVPSDNLSKKKEKNKKEELWKWTKKVKVTKQEECHLVPEVQPNLNETISPIGIFSLMTGLEELLELIVEQSNAIIRNLEILQNLHFADNRKDDKTDKALKMKPVTDHLNSKFSEVLSNDSEQSIDEHMGKFKGRSGMKQYIKAKLMKWGFKFWFHFSSKSGYLHQMDIYLGRKQIPEFNLGLGEK